MLGLYPLLLELCAPDEVQEYLDAAMTVYFDPNEFAQLPLIGGEPEVYQQIGQRSPNFQPSLLSASDWRMTTIPQVRSRVPNYCESNPGTVRSDKVEPLKRAIRNVHHDASDYYIGVYESIIQRLEHINPKSLAQTHAPRLDRLIKRNGPRFGWGSTWREFAKCCSRSNLFLEGFLH